MMLRPSVVLLAAASFASAHASQTQVSISELFVNPPGTDQSQEGFELYGPPSTSLAGYKLLIVEGDGTGAGLVDVVLDLGAFSTGSNGVFVWRDSAAVIAPGIDPSSAVNVADFAPDIENGTNTYILGFGTAPAPATDLDTNNDGTLDVALSGFTVVDAVSLVENDGTSNFAYADDLGFTNLGPFAGPAPVAHTPDAAFRIYNASTPCGWVSGDVLGTNPGGPYSFAIATGEAFNFDLQGLTAADVNLGQVNPIADSDGDGAANGCDGCPTDRSKDAPGACGCFIPEGCSLGVDVNELSATSGGTQQLFLYGGAANAGKQYIVIGSVTGTTPGLPVAPGVTLPLNYDFYLIYSIGNPNTFILSNSFATLDGAGNATASFNLPPVALPFAVTIHHAYLVVEGGSIPVFASNAAPVTLNP